MLETLPRANVSQDVHRLANLTYIAAFAEKKGLTIDEVTEVIRFTRDDVTRKLMEGPFQPKTVARKISSGIERVSRTGSGRYFTQPSTGTTAGKEAAHHYGRRAAGDPASPRAVYYSIVRCRFSGEIIDLRPQLPDWPDLVSEDYTFCNALGREAHAVALGAFLSPSARQDGGTTVPAFIEGNSFGACDRGDSASEFRGRKCRNRAEGATVALCEGYTRSYTTAQSGFKFRCIFRRLTGHCSSPLDRTERGCPGPSNDRQHTDSD